MSDDILKFFTFLNTNGLVNLSVIRGDNDEGLENRIKLQKLAYFAQNCFGWNLGYDFSIYRYGPYSVSLANKYFHKELYNRIPVEYRNVDIPTGFDEKAFLSLVSGKNKDWLEIATTLHDVYSEEYTKDEVLKTVKRIKHNYDSDYIDSICNELEENDIIIFPQ